ncbi:PadR family transcriptional regulator [Mycetocola zhujimingii]|uniref:PadR family transcriptional regulator n=1 Tax=Mycetocola zhujimingii TaxID=2079792 RepID=A0A2U1THU9_9MICO|nr:PadR family transcriptional regulator [Mycetocola zhujimingii]PWC08469.1 PadR family transcriptional regulator [Mycetocola zhujimingii]
MKLRHAVLGLLSLQPQSGYDLGRAFAGSVAHFWYADQSQIYRLLDDLDAEGAITTEVIRQKGRPDRRVHSLTDTGREELDAWLRSPLDVQRPKNAFLARLFFAGSLSPEHVRRLLDEAEDLVTDSRERLRTIEHSASTLDEVVQNATLQFGISHAETTLAWIAETREAVAAFERGTSDE